MVKIMKKEYIIGLCLIVLIVGIAGVVLVTHPMEMVQTDVENQSPPGQDQSPSGHVAGRPLSDNIVVNAPKTNVPDKMPVYKTIPPAVTKADAIALAKKFNITDFNEPKEGDSVISVSSKDVRYSIQLHKNGGQYFEDYKRSDTPNGIDIAENLPSDEEARKIANSFLKERGLLPDGAVVGGTKHRKVYGSNGNRTQTVDWEDILVYYTRELDGMNVEGTQFEVEVGGHGDIIRFFSNWKDYQAIGEYPIITRDSSINILKQKGTSATSGPEKPDTVSINDIYLAYETTAVAYKEVYLEPVYVFKGEALKNGTAVKPIKEFIPALTDESKKSLSTI
jgi:hypothetical protein